MRTGLTYGFYCRRTPERRRRTIRTRPASATPANTLADGSGTTVILIMEGPLVMNWLPPVVTSWLKN